MTAFEHWLETNGGTLIFGGAGDLSTAGTLYRMWVYGPTATPIQIGLIRLNDSSVIGLRYPFISLLPADQFEQFASRVIGSGLEVDPSIAKLMQSGSSLGLMIPLNYEKS